MICKEMNDNLGFVNTGMLSNTKSSISPSSSIECEMDKEDSWVVVKKQMTTVLIAPTSPPEQSQTRTTLPVPDTTESISTVVEKKRKEKHALANKDKNKYLLPYDSTLVGETKATVPRDLPLSMKSKPPMPLLPTGALSIANKRLRAHNLERKLKELGGLRNWLMSYKELQRFIDVLERKKVGVYQLANVISMSALKDMGFAPVGPRRKLICEIDRLCQPHCFKSL